METWSVFANKLAARKSPPVCRQLELLQAYTSTTNKCNSVRWHGQGAKLAGRSVSPCLVLSVLRSPMGACHFNVQPPMALKSRQIDTTGPS